jgi:hypothetical protein
VKDDQLSHIIKHEEWKFSAFEYLNRYFILIVPIGFFILGIYPLTINEVTNRISLNNILSLYPFGLLLAGGLFFLISYKRIESEKQFRRIELRRALSLEELKDTVVEIGWFVEKANEKYIVAETDISLFSWGEEVTLIQCGSYLLINSRPSGSQPFTFNRDRFNYNKLKEFLEIKLYA